MLKVTPDFLPLILQNPLRINETASKFISEDELERYLKLKARGFVKDLKFLKQIQPNQGFDYNYCTIHLELHKYNDKLEIYYGLLELRIDPGVYSPEGSPYRITRAIAGADIQIKALIKEDIDLVIEMFAEDYYYIQELK